MPHYNDGSLAKVGDVVVGPTYNKQGLAVGVIREITSDSDTCNCKVQVFARRNEDVLSLFPYEDYGEVRAFKKVL